MAKKTTSRPVWLRRATQTVFLILFLYLFLEAAYHAGGVVGGAPDLYFDFDPLLLLTVWLGGHVAATVLLLSLITVIATLVFGRWFCGWICPFGTLHNLMSSWRGGTNKAKVESGGYSRWHHSKYLVLLAVLISSVLGTNLVGWIDPFSFLFRSMTMVVFPAVNAAAQHFFELIYRTDPGIGPLRLTLLSEPIYHWLRSYLIMIGQPHYFWCMLFGLLFGVVIVLNLLRARFWCKHICPLGALLGVLGKNPVVRLETDLERCGDCKLCLIDCQGGAGPNGQADWKPSECMFCLNCQSSCPSNALQFKISVPRGENNAK